MYFITAFGDTHVGSTTGLMPVTGVQLYDQNFIYPNRFQYEVSEFWNQCWARRMIQFAGLKKSFPQAKWITLDAGDNIDNTHHESTQVWGNPVLHCKTCISMLQPVRELSYKMIGVSGTEAHVGTEGQYDESVGSALGFHPLQGRFCPYHVRLNIDNVLIDLAHKGPNPGKYTYNLGDGVRRYARGIVISDLIKGARCPDIIIRGHVHKKRHERVDVENYSCDIFTLPSWQLKTMYAHSAVSEEHIADIGMLWLIINEGKLINWGWDCLELDETPEEKIE